MSLIGYFTWDDMLDLPPPNPTDSISLVVIYLAGKAWVPCSIWFSVISCWSYPIFQLGA